MCYVSGVDVFQALADETRRRLLLALARQPRTAGALAATEAHSRPAVSRHLRVLRESGLVRAEPLGRTRVYSLERTALAPVREILELLDARTVAAPEVASLRTAAAAAPIPAERFDALELEVRRAAREPGGAQREEIA
jgi:DNA-binding transcriptional ArsR family regulator